MTYRATLNRRRNTARMFSVLGLGISHLIQGGHVLATSTEHNKKHDQALRKQSSLGSMTVPPAVLKDGAGIHLNFKF